MYRIIFAARSKLRKVLFFALSVTFVCASNISGTAERICAKFTGKTWQFVHAVLEHDDFLKTYFTR